MHAYSAHIGHHHFPLVRLMNFISYEKEQSIRKTSKLALFDYDCAEGFSLGSPVFFPSEKTNIPNSNSIWTEVARAHGASSLNIVI